MTMRVISLAHTIWSERWLNRQQLLSRLGRKVPIVYSNGCWFTWDRHGDEWRRAGWRGHFKRTDNVWLDEVPRWLMRSPRLGRLDHAALVYQARRWRRQLAGHGDGPLILQLFHPAFVDYVEPVAPDAVVYQPYDLLEAMPGWTPEQEAQERALLARADLIVASSEPTAVRLREKSGKEVVVVPNGVATETFDRAIAEFESPPEDLDRIPRPRVGYVGSIYRAVDLGLFAALAKRNPRWNIVFIGGETPGRDERTERDLAECQRLPNVHFLGAKAAHQVPAYMLGMDVNTIGLRVGEGTWVDAAYPLKLQEYLACGLPIVSADLATVRPFAEVVHIARTLDEWQLGIEEALASGGVGSAEQRRSVARLNSWSRRCDQLYALFEQLARRPGARVD